MFSRHRHAVADGAPPSPSLIRRPFLRKAATHQPAMLAMKDNSANNIMKENNNREDPAPVPVTRNRLETEDTFRVSNLNLNLPDLLIDDDNPFLECHQSYSPEAVQRAKAKRRSFQEREKQAEAESEAAKLMDCDSTMSSLSEGSFKQRPPPPPPAHVAVPLMVAQHPHTHHGPALVTPPAAPHQHHALVPPSPTPQQVAPRIVPPKFICFKVKTKIPEWLLEDEEDQQPQHHREEICQNNSLRTEDDDTAENHPQPQLNYRHHPQQASPHWSPLTPSRVPHQCQVQYGGPPPRSPQPHPRLVTQQIPYHHHQHHRHPMLPPPVWTGVPSPANTRPTMGRYKSESSSGNFPTRALTPRPSTAAGSVEAFPMSPCNTANIIPDNNGPRRRASFTPPPRTLSPSPMTPHSMQLQLPTKHQRRQKHQHAHKHRRNASAGEVSGLESLWTAPTTASSSHSFLATMQQVHPNSAHAKRTSAVVQELRTMWSKVRNGSNNRLMAIPPELVMMTDHSNSSSNGSSTGSGAAGSWNTPMIPRAQGCLT